MNSKDWVWYGYPGHFIGARYCNFRLCTEVGDYLVSTVGDYRSGDRQDKPQEIGVGRTFETFVFVSGPRCVAPGCGCNMPSIGGQEIDSLAANSPGEAQANHLTLCKKYARRNRRTAIDAARAASQPPEGQTL